MFQKILLAVDGSEHADRAAAHAVQMAKKFQGSIDIVYAVDGSRAKTDVLSSTDKYQIKKKREEKMAGAKKLAVTEGVPCETHILHGDPGSAIVEFANNEGFDCVVVGSRGLGQIKEMFIGSVSRQVTKQADCPVLIVK